MPEKRIILTDDRYGKTGTPSSRHAFLELIEDVCATAFGATKCSCMITRRGIVWSELLKGMYSD